MTNTWKQFMPKSDADYWEVWVGSQSPVEFMSYAKPGQSPEEAAEEYVEWLERDNRNPIMPDTLAEILARYIRANT